MRRRPLLALALAPALVGCAGTIATAGEPTTRPSVPRAAPRAIEAGGPERITTARQAPPRAPAMAARFRPSLVEDYCADRDLATPAAEDLVLAILDRSYGLSAADTPDDLVPASAAGFAGPSGTHLVREVLVDDLAAMRSALEAAGLTIQIDSAHRSYEEQAATFSAWVARLGSEGAALRTARPGHSEHHLGTAIDVTSPGWSGRFGDWAVESAEGAWMAEHAWEYGFVMSYPAGAELESCYGYEPWHYRWIGRSEAAAHRESGLTLRPFLELNLGE